MKTTALKTTELAEIADLKRRIQDLERRLAGRPAPGINSGLGIVEIRAYLDTDDDVWYAMDPASDDILGTIEVRGPLLHAWCYWAHVDRSATVAVYQVTRPSLRTNGSGISEPGSTWQWHLGTVADGGGTWRVNYDADKYWKLDDAGKLTGYDSANKLIELDPAGSIKYTYASTGSFEIKNTGEMVLTDTHCVISLDPAGHKVNITFDDGNSVEIAKNDFSPYTNQAVKLRGVRLTDIGFVSHEALALCCFTT
jgi:hypothetical protein